MKDYLAKAKKTPKTKQRINAALEILDAVGIPVDDMPVLRRMRMAEAILALADVLDDWSQAKCADNGHFLTTRGIIKVVNPRFQEKISSGSYDDIRRKDLKLPRLAELVVNSGEMKGSATNDSTRGYALSSEFGALVRTYGTSQWSKRLAAFMKNRPSLAEQLQRKREVKRIPVILPGGKELAFSLGKHNELQKAIIEEFLPIWGHGAEVLYVGDTSKKLLHIERERLKELGFFELSHDELPDVIAHSRSKNWLYVIEAVHSSGPISEVRLMELKKLLKGCKAGIVYVTAFLTRKKHAKYADQIAFETEVWTADYPDHLQHINGPRFQGPYA
ncbi:MAG: hypothetical protein KIT10_14820 [Flavobacteriales bacterium]|nr:hypothetical protein [Flavobacteriales bacterium]